MSCPACPNAVIADAVKHAEWHQIVEQQTGLTQCFDARALAAARGFTTPTPASETVLDRRAIESGRRVNGQRRRSARGDA